MYARLTDVPSSKLPFQRLVREIGIRWPSRPSPSFAPSSLHLITKLPPISSKAENGWQPLLEASAPNFKRFLFGSAAHTAQPRGHAHSSPGSAAIRPNRGHARPSSGSAAHTAQPRGHAHSSSGSAAIRPNRGHARPSLQLTAQARITLAPARNTAQARGHARPDQSHLNRPDDSTKIRCLPFKSTTGNIAADHYLNFSAPTHSTVDAEPHLSRLTNELNRGRGATSLPSHF